MSIAKNETAENLGFDQLPVVRLSELLIYLPWEARLNLEQPKEINETRNVTTDGSRTGSD